MYEQYTCKYGKRCKALDACMSLCGTLRRGGARAAGEMRSAPESPHYFSDADSYQRMLLIERLLLPRVAGHVPRILAVVCV